jgi:hypothetical protein
MCVYGIVFNTYFEKMVISCLYNKFIKLKLETHALPLLIMCFIYSVVGFTIIQVFGPEPIDPIGFTLGIPLLIICVYCIESFLPSHRRDSILSSIEEIKSKVG